MSARRAGVWILLPQAVSRLTSIYVFAAVATRASAAQLGAVALGTALASAALALAPAMVGKPLSVAEPGVRASQGRDAVSAAVLCSVVAAVVLGGAAWSTSGLPRLALMLGALALPAVMVVEAVSWRALLVQGPKRAGLLQSGAYGLQALVVTFAALSGSVDLLVLSPALGIALAAVVVALAVRVWTFTGARAWLTTSRPNWLPYVVGVAASIALVQAIPVVLASATGFAAASAYRAGELAFGGTNLLIGVTTQTLLTQDVRQVRRTYAMLSGLLAVVAAVNGVVLHFAPEHLLQAVLGPAAPLLLDALAIVTAQRAALAISSVGAILLLSRFSPRRVGLLDVLVASISASLLIIGAAFGGLEGGLAGLAGAEVLIALVYLQLLRRATASKTDLPAAH